MAAPIINPLPPAPLPSDPVEVFDQKASAFVDAQTIMVGQINAATAWVETRADNVDSAVADAQAYADEAAQAAADASQDRIDAFTYKNAAELAASNAATSESNAADSELAASGYASVASLSETAAEGFRDEAQTFRNEALQFRNEAEAIAIADAIDDASLESYQVRSAFNDSIGNFENIDVSGSTAISALQFARITATGASVTVTLPTSPSEGQMVMVGNLTSRSDHIIAVGSTPVKGRDAGGSIVIDKQFYTVTMKYINSTYGWEIL